MRLSAICAMVALVGAGLTACGGGDGDGGGPNPTAGSLNVVLTNASAVPGAIMFAVSGGQIDGVTSSYTTYDHATATNSRKILLTGDINVGTVAQIQVPDVSKVDNYVVQVLQVAALGNAAIPYRSLPTGSFPIDVQ